MLDWPIKLAQAFQGLITKENMTDPSIIINQFRIKPELLSWSFLDVYFPLQPLLLASLVVITLLIIFLIIGVVFAGLALRMGFFSDQLYDKDRKNKPKFMVSMLGLAFCWLLLVGSTIFMVCYLLQLSSSHLTLASDKPLVINPLNKTNDQFVSITLSSIQVVNRKWKQLSSFGETDVLNKYNEIREKGYEFRPLESMSDYDIQSFGLGLIIFSFTVILFVMVIMMGVGIREHYQCYHPMERSTSSNLCGRTSRCLAYGLLLITPIISFISMILMAYSQVHNVVCPYVQHVMQNQDMESYVNANVIFFDPYNLLDFLNDLTVERLELNQSNCQGYVKPLQGTWVILSFMAFLSLVTSVFLWKASKHLLKIKSKIYLSQKETFGTLTRKPVPFGPEIIKTNRY